jgi:MerR family transcriptional regulator, copper efflux regulator
MDQPIGCTLSAADYAERAQDTHELARRALRSREQIPEGARLTFEPGADTERRLREIVAAEARCCAFLRMDLRSADDALVLDVTGPAEAEPIIAELFA